MVSGYVSRQAVNEMLAVKDGEIDFVKKQRDEQIELNKVLTETNLQLLAQLTNIKTR